LLPQQSKIGQKLGSLHLNGKAAAPVIQKVHIVEFFLPPSLWSGRTLAGVVWFSTLINHLR
jgi:hypothetical protein